MNEDDFTMKHLKLYFLAGVVGGLDLFIAFRIKREYYKCPFSLYGFPLIIGIILTLGWIIGVIFFCNFNRENDKRKEKREKK